jgi:hypothetical protein
MAEAFDPSDELDTDIVDNMGGDAIPKASPGVNDATASGECSVCGLPGITGLRCSDPDCPGTVQKLPDAKPAKTDDIADTEPESDRYEESLLKDDGPEVVSFEDLAETDDESEDEDAETL